MAYRRNLVIEREKKKNGVTKDGRRSGNQKRETEVEGSGEN
jgi:hypothetical protein